jgi:hypothetical protein
LHFHTLFLNPYKYKLMLTQSFFQRENISNKGDYSSSESKEKKRITKKNRCLNFPE